MTEVRTSSDSACQPLALRCEYLPDPIGLDVPHPRLSWRMDDPRRGAAQTAYRIVVAQGEGGLTSGRGLVWDSGKRQSDQQLVVYDGKPLAPFARYFWRVELWDRDGRATAPSEVATFEMGMMDPGQWRGSWISDSASADTKGAAYYRAEATVSKRVAFARAYIAVAGLYELHVNGSKIGDRRLDPMFTRYDRRVLYSSFDVTDRIKKGQNAVGVVLGDGWFNHQSRAEWGFDKAPWRGRPMFCFDMRIGYADGSVEYLSSSSDWKTSSGPIVANSIYTGEKYDARRELPGWDKPGYDDEVWANAVYRSAPTNNIVAQVLQPIRAVERVAAKSLSRIDEKTYVFDLGRNIAGISELKVTGKRGVVLKIKHGELLDGRGRVDVGNIDGFHRPIDDSDPFQTDVYTLKGEGEEIFSPRFNYKGFQYVEVSSNAAIQLTKKSLVGLFVCSDAPTAGAIASSNPVLDKIWEATRSSYLSNLHGYPTDCPQREKNGWTGDGHIAVEMGLYGFDGITIYEKWLDDHRDEQQPNGALPAIIPTAGWGYNWANGPDWTSSIAIIPWNLYLFYGDTRPLEENYEAIKRYVDRIDRHNPSGLTAWGLGDWVPVKSNSPVEFTSSIYYYVDATILSRAAAILGLKSDKKRYAALASKIKREINAKYFNREDGIYGNGLQTEMSAALFWGIVPPASKKKVAANLAKRVVEDGRQLDVGLLGSKTILNALSENGYPDLAYELASRTEYPAWGWWIANGATTLHENWSLEAKKDRSLNHIMFGEVGAWLFKSPGGIKPDPESPGFKNTLLEPHFVDGLDWFEASHESTFGTIKSAWRREGEGVVFTATIPPNATATLKLEIEEGRSLHLDGRPVAADTRFVKPLSGKKGVRSYRVSAGTYAFEIR